MQISNNVFMTAYQGVQTGYNQLDQNSQKLANPNNPDKAEAIIDNLSAKNQVETNLKVIKNDNDRLGTLLDIMA